MLSSGVRIGLGLLGLGADGHTASLFTRRRSGARTRSLRHRGAAPGRTGRGERHPGADRDHRRAAVRAGRA